MKPTNPPPTSAEFILRYRVPISAMAKAERLLAELARRLPGARLSCVERADYEDHSLHVRRRSVVK